MEEADLREVEACRHAEVRHHQPRTRGGDAGTNAVEEGARSADGSRGMIEYNTLSLAVEGYPGRQSYRPGEEVTFHCSSRARTFSAEVARIGASREVVWRKAGIAGTEQPVPPDAYARRLRLAGDLRLHHSPRLALGLLRGGAHRGRRHRARGDQPRLLRRSAPPSRRATTRSLLVLGTNTYNAYNKWGGAVPLYGRAARLLPAADRARLRHQADRPRRLRRPRRQHHAGAGPRP